jgi:glycosyltransferase involved in cell wall biosynthesis
MNYPSANVPVTVLMPVYNAEQYILEAVNSILNQTHQDFILMIINDGCTDRTMEIIDSIDDPRIQVINNEENIKLIATLNKGLSLVKTEFVARMDADDFSMPERLEVQLAYMKANPQVGACGTWYDNILADGTERNGGRYLPSHEEIKFKNLYQLHIIHGTALMRMRIIRENNLQFDASFPHAEDYDFFTRMAQVSELHNVQQSLYKIRHHQESVSKKFSDVQEAGSNKVKRALFKEIGVAVTDDDLDLYREFMHQNYSIITGEQLTRFLELISDLIQSNSKSVYLPAEYFRKELAIRVLHLFNQLAGKEKGLAKKLNAFEHFRFSDDPKLVFTTYGKVLLRN